MCKVAAETFVNVSIKIGKPVFRNPRPPQIHTHIHAHTCTLSLTCTYTCIHICTHTDTHTHTHTHAQIYCKEGKKVCKSPQLFGSNKVHKHCFHFSSSLFTVAEETEHDFSKLVTENLSELHLGTAPDKLNKVKPVLNWANVCSQT